MSVGPLKLYFKKRLVGLITEATWSDFPWIAGRFLAKRMSSQARAVLEWVEAQSQADEWQDPPFEDEVLEGWSIVKPGGSRVELIYPPIVHFATGIVEWRE